LLDFACDEKNPLSNYGVRIRIEKSRIFHYLALSGFRGIQSSLSLSTQVRGLPISQETTNSASPRDDGSLYKKVLLKDKDTYSKSPTDKETIDVRA
jgi:hypothetical protein